jgi:Ca-activated chloride channel family protein
MLRRTAPAPIMPAEPPLALRRWRWEVATPAWLMSLVVHALLVILLGYVASQRVHGTNGPLNPVLISSSSTSADDEDFFDDERTVQMAGGESSSEQGGGDPGTSSDAAESSLAEIASGPAPVDATTALPSAAPAAVTPGEPSPGAATGAGSLLNGPRRQGSVQGKFARTHVYGAAGEGNTFVYVFDRSSSMGTGGNSLLASAKHELLASLDDLGAENRFHIIFYNEKPTKMDLGRSFAGLVFADNRAKELAKRFVEGIVAAGGTRHFDALMEALKLRADVVFFLTDADEPELSDGQLWRIRSMNSGNSTINTIEFGDRPQPRRDNFLARIARENGGQYVYIDVTKARR